MKNNLLEHIILYVLMVCVSLILATLVRISAISLGVDDFTAFIIFVIVLAVQLVIYLSIHVFLQNLMIPLIGKGLSKIPFFKRKIENRHSPTINQQTDNIEAILIEQIRIEQLQNKIKDKEDKINTILNYTRKSFALYLSDTDLEQLCQNLQIYINKLNTDNFKAVRVKELTALDLRHFGWNMWNAFKPRNQMDIAHFLKIVFPDIFKDAEVESIKRHLKDDERKGILKIEERIN